MNRTFADDTISALASRLPQSPAPPAGRQPVHTMYGGAHLFSADTCSKLGKLALKSLEMYAPDAASFDVTEKVYARVIEKLHREPVEDFRIDFEDGYGNRSDGEEDGHAVAAAREVARGRAAGLLPAFFGIRIKPLTATLYARSVRTLDLFFNALAAEGPLPPHFAVTLPKVSEPEQVAALVELIEMIENSLGFPERAIRIELMVETPRAIVSEDGKCGLPGLVRAAKGRCLAAHLGAYDYTAACDIAAAHQLLTSPVCDFVRHTMQAALAGTGVWLVDGATNILPVPVHRGAELTDDQQRENGESMHRAWHIHSRHVRRSIENGFYQSWDLHPAQLPARYAAVYSFFLEHLEDAAARLQNFLDRSAQASLKAGVFDDAATGQGLLNFFFRAVNCGALSEEEARKHSGLNAGELRTGSFLEILRRRGVI